MIADPQLMPKFPSTTDEAVLAWLHRFSCATAVTRQQQKLLENAVVGLANTLKEIRAIGAAAPFVDQPLAIHAALRGDRSEVAIALAAACSLTFLSLDIFDDLADGDRQPHWDGWSSGEINLAAATILSMVPLILAQLDAPAETRTGLQVALSRGLLRMSAGQQADLAAFDIDTLDAEAIEQSVVGKSGEQQATFCELAARLAGLTDARIAAFAEIGRCLGTAGQLASDCEDLICDPRMRDLANGARTLPIAMLQRRLQGTDRDEFRDLLRAARADPAARLRVREMAKEKGAVREVLLRAGVYVQRARRAAEEALPDPVNRTALEPLFG